MTPLLVAILLASPASAVAPASPGAAIPGEAAPGRTSVSPKVAPILPPTSPRALSANALRDELRAASQRRQEELAAIARERAQLEKMASDLAAERAAFEVEKKLTTDQKMAASGARTGRPPVAGVGGAPAGATEPGASPQLAKALKGMKPEQAAALVGRLERPAAVALLRLMRPADIGAVLEKMKPDVAADLFSMMASASPHAGTR